MQDGSEGVRTHILLQQRAQVNCRWRPLIPFPLSAIAQVSLAAVALFALRRKEQMSLAVLALLAPGQKDLMSVAALPLLPLRQMAMPALPCGALSGALRLRASN